MKKVISGFIAGVLLTVSISVAASVGINDVRIANDTKLMVLGKQVKTDIVYGVKDGDQGGKNYVSARDLAEALGYKVDWDGETKSILVSKKGKIGLDDKIGESDATLKQLLKESGYDINNMYSSGKFNSLKSTLDLFELPDEVLALLVVDDYKQWLEGGDPLFEDFWNEVFKK